MCCLLHFKIQVNPSKITNESDKTVIWMQRRLIHLRNQMTVTGDQYIKGGGDIFNLMQPPLISYIKAEQVTL